MILQDFARRGVVYQVSFEWLEPTDWSFERSDRLDILEKSEIKTPEIIRRASNYVHHARLRRAFLFMALAVAVSVAALILGIRNRSKARESNRHVVLPFSRQYFGAVFAQETDVPTLVWLRLGIAKTLLQIIDRLLEEPPRKRCD
jgi:hypothetical protein